MYITLESDYAVRIVAVLCSEGEKLDANAISERTCVTRRFSLKILRKLVEAGIVRSFKGMQGGYQINMKPEEITLRMVIEAVEGTYYFSRCLSENYSCGRSENGCCKFRNAFSEITDTVRQKLDTYNFSDASKSEKPEI